MAEGLIIFEVLDELEEEETRGLASAMKSLRDAQDPFELPEIQFKANFRLNKEGALYLLHSCSPYIEPGVKSTHIDSMRTVMCALQFFANGSYQRVVGNNLVTLLSQPMVSRSIKKMINILNTHLTPIWIRFPRNEAEREELKVGFTQLGMPNVIGLVDGTHIAIFKPRERENVFVNRKSYHSINAQIVCNASLRIININARFPGSSHDSYVWKSSHVDSTMRANYLNDLRDIYIIGDSGYPSKPWLLTPFRFTEPNSPEEAYNTRLCTVRSSVERCIGLLKGRFRCLMKDRTLHYAPHTASKIITARAILHNIALRYVGNEDAVMIREEVDMLPPLDDNVEDGEFRREGQITRQQYVNQYFNL